MAMVFFFSFFLFFFFRKRGGGEPLAKLFEETVLVDHYCRHLGRGSKCSQVPGGVRRYVEENRLQDAT
jgi:hypothetical protein